MVQHFKVASVELRAREAATGGVIVDLADPQGQLLRLVVTPTQQLSLMTYFQGTASLLRQVNKGKLRIEDNPPEGLLIIAPLANGAELPIPITRKGLEELIRSAMDVLEHID